MNENMLKVLRCFAHQEEMLTAYQISARTGLSIGEVEEAITEAYKLGFIE